MATQPKKYPKVIDVHKPNLLSKGYYSFSQWKINPKHLYIGRDMSKYVPGAIGSKYQNKYKVSTYGLEECLRLYYNDWKDADLSELFNYEELGCWCHNRDDVPKSLSECQCHGDVLLLIMHQKYGD